MKEKLNDTKEFYHSEAVKLINCFYELNTKTDTCFSVNCNSENIAECDKTGHGCGVWVTHAKQCATVLCDKMIEEYTISSGGEAPGFDAFAKFKVSNWQKIKVEIENI
jgi:hypothetical protein